MWETYGAASLSRADIGHSGGYTYKITVSGSGGIKDTQTVTSDQWYLSKGFVSISGTSTNISIVHTNANSTGDTSHRYSVGTDWSQIDTTFKTGSISLQTQVAPADQCTFYFDDYFLIPLDILSISGVPATQTNSLMADRAGNLSRAIRVDGGDALTYSGGDCHFTASSGTIGTNFKLPWAYNEYEQDAYFYDIDGVLRCYYDQSSARLNFDMYTVSGWGYVSVSCGTTFASGWHELSIAWDNTDAIAMCFDNDIISYSGTWTAQTLPNYLYVGSDHNGEYQIDGSVDNVFDHSTKLADAYLRDLGSEERKYLPINTFLVTEQTGTLVRKNTGATR